MTLRVAVVVSAFVVALIAPLRAQTTGTGHLSGRVTTTRGDSLPGVVVTLEGGGAGIITTVTGADGRFVIETLVDGSAAYTLKAVLPGFQDATRIGLKATPGQTTVLPDIALRLGCIAPDLIANRGFAAEAAVAALVAHLRIETVGTAREWTVAGGCLIASEARVLILADERGQPQRRVDVLVPARYQGGIEAVLALTWDSVARRYTAWGLVLPVTNGVATLDEISIGSGLDREMPVLELLDLLAPLKVPLR